MVRFIPTVSLGNILLEKNNKGTLNNFSSSLKGRADYDKIDFVSMYKDVTESLFHMISDCYKRIKLIIISNL